MACFVNRCFVFSVSLLLFLSLVSAVDMPIPHFTPADCACPELGWQIQSNYSSYGLDLSCIYQRSGEKTDYYNTLSLHITSWYDPKETADAFEIYRNYDYPEEKTGYGADQFVVEDISEPNKISFIYRIGNSSYHLSRWVHHGDTPVIVIGGNYNRYAADKSQQPIDGQVIGWADALEACGKRLIDAQDLSPGKVKGKVSILGFPLKYATIYIDPAQKTTTNDKGEFSLSVPNREHYDVTLEFQYEKNSRIFYRVIMDKEPVKLKLEVVNDKITAMAFDSGTSSFSVENVSQAITQELALEKLVQDKDLLLVPDNYLHMQEALEFYADVLKVDLSRTTVDLFVYNYQRTAYNFEENKSWINLDGPRSSFDDPYRPFTVYHEFTHYVQHTLIGSAAFASYIDESNINHGGYANAKSSDSFSEGLAAFMATVIANHYDRYWADAMSNKSSLYPFLGSLESNVQAWDFQGRGEEFAMAGALWDLVDGPEEARKDTAADKARIRSIMEERFKAYDFDKDGAWGRSEFIHSLMDNEEYNGNFDGFFDERELPILAEGFAGANGSQEFLNKLLAYGKTEPGSLTQAEMHLFIKDNLAFFEADLKGDLGASYSDLPKTITLEMLMDAVAEGADDDPSNMPVPSLWSLINKANFTMPYSSLSNADSIFISHGLYVETSEGDRNYTFGEPYLDRNKNKRRDADEPSIDLGVMQYSPPEKIGVASNYERPSRKSSEPFPGQYLKVNEEVPFYSVEYVLSTKSYFGLKLPTMVYALRSRNENGLIYVPMPKNAMISVTPEGVTADEPLVFSSSSFLQQYGSSVDKGFFLEHKFTYTGTPPAFSSTMQKGASPSAGMSPYLLVLAAAVLVAAVLFFRGKGKK